MKKIVIFLSFSLISLPLFAVDKCTNRGCVSSISDLVTNADGLIYIGTPLDESLANCTPISNKYFTLNPTAGNAKEVYSSLLAAYISGKKIQLRIKEGHPQCELHYVSLSTSF